MEVRRFQAVHRTMWICSHDNGPSPPAVLTLYRDVPALVLSFLGRRRVSKMWRPQRSIPPGYLARKRVHSAHCRGPDAILSGAGRAPTRSVSIPQEEAKAEDRWQRRAERIARPIHSDQLMRNIYGELKSHRLFSFADEVDALYESWTHCMNRS